MFACLYLPRPANSLHVREEGRGKRGELPHATHAAHATYATHEPYATLVQIARDFSPRVETHGDRTVTLDISGLDRLIGEPRSIGEELRRAAADAGLGVHIAVAASSTAAILLAHARAGLTVVAPGTEAATLAPLPLRTLTQLDFGLWALDSRPDVDQLTRWGLRTLGDLAAIPSSELSARLGQPGLRWQRLARGEEMRPLVPAGVAESFEESLDLEWPIDGLEPLSFVLGRLLEPLTTHLERRGRGAAVLHVRLQLVTRTIHERSLQLPAPMRDARTFRTLLLLDLESHPPSAAIDRVVVAVDPTPARIVQFSLLTRPIPSPEQLSTLTARLAALIGEDRCGSPVVVDSWQPGAFAMKPFNPGSGIGDPGSGRTPDAQCPRIALRRFRIPVPARVRMEHDKPQHVAIDRAAAHLGSRITDPIGSRIAVPGSQLGGCVQACAGPWRTSGHWWTDKPQADREKTSSPCLRVSVARSRCEEWDRDEWDVTLSDGATYRIFRERATHAWFVDGSYD